jgi:hypothetical protein
MTWTFQGRQLNFTWKIFHEVVSEVFNVAIGCHIECSGLYSNPRLHVFHCVDDSFPGGPFRTKAVVSGFDAMSWWHWML